MSKIGIVTVLYNSEKVLEDFFKSLDEQTFKDFQLYVIDNASQDNSLALCNELAQNVSFETKIFAENENWGVAKGNNIGIINALADRCEYVLLSNNDIVLNPDTVQVLYDGLNETGASMAVPKIYFYDTGRIWCAGGRFSKIKGSTKHIGYNQVDNGQFNKVCKMDYAPTCFMLIRSDVFYKVGLMDEKYFVYYDDSDFVWRAVMQNKETLIYIPHSTLKHKESSSTGGGLSDFTIYHLARNSIYFIHKNFSFPQKQLTFTYKWLYKMMRMPYVFSKEQVKVIEKGLRDGKLMCRK
ncbi:MAG: glycosyltransferase family 2 protein [Phocaeicola sp.]|nr:glycosyltransferase family 2 protein [Phocaeicola sp.]